MTEMEIMDEISKNIKLFQYNKEYREKMLTQLEEATERADAEELEYDEEELNRARNIF